MTKHHNLLSISKQSTSKYRLSPKFAGISIYNNLPNRFQTLNEKQFKKEIKRLKVYMSQENFLLISWFNACIYLCICFLFFWPFLYIFLISARTNKILFYSIKNMFQFRLNCLILSKLNMYIQVFDFFTPFSCNEKNPEKKFHFLFLFHIFRFRKNWIFEQCI